MGVDSLGAVEKTNGYFNLNRWRRAGKRIISKQLISWHGIIHPVPPALELCKRTRSRRSRAVLRLKSTMLVLLLSTWRGPVGLQRDQLTGNEVGTPRYTAVDTCKEAVVILKNSPISVGSSGKKRKV